MKVLFASIALPIVLAIAVAGCGSQSSAPLNAAPSITATPAATAFPTPKIPPTPVIMGGDTAAIVNGNKIPMSNFRMLLGLAVRQSAGQPGATTKVLASQTMIQLIDDEVVREYAASHGLLVTSAEYTSRIKRDEKQFGSEKGLKAKLAQIGLSFSAYQTLVHTSVQRHKVANAVAPLIAAHVRHILIGTATHKPKRTDAAAHALAQQILTQLQHGGSFATLAKRYSDDTGSGKLGGDLGTFCTGLGVMVPTFDQAAATFKPLHPGIVKSQYGYHIVEVLSRGFAAPGQCNQPATATSAAQQVVAEQTQTFQTWVRNLAAHAKVQRIAKVA